MIEFLQIITHISANNKKSCLTCIPLSCSSAICATMYSSGNNWSRLKSGLWCKHTEAQCLITMQSTSCRLFAFPLFLCKPHHDGCKMWNRKCLPFPSFLFSMMFSCFSDSWVRFVPSGLITLYFYFLDLTSTITESVSERI